MLGSQLYTVRHKMTDRENIYDTLTKLKEMGCECVQLASSVENMLRSAGK